MISCANLTPPITPNIVSSESKTRLAILASGGGSNADKICAYFNSHNSISIAVIISNRKDAGVFSVAEAHHIESVYLPKSKWSDASHVLELLHSKEITHLVLAGFLMHIPDWLVNAYPNLIINIHPSLLPLYGGKGMFGHHVHEAVKASGDSVSGITIHEVNEHYDEGKILFQQEVLLDPNDTPDDIATTVLAIEHAAYSQVIEEWILKSRIDSFDEQA